MKTFIGEVCKPAGIYLFLSILVIIITAVFIAVKKVSPIGINAINSFVTLVFVIVWTYILNFLCNRVSITLVWLLVIINFVLLFLSVSSTVSGSLSYNKAPNSKEGLETASDKKDKEKEKTKEKENTKNDDGAKKSESSITESIDELQKMFNLIGVK
jgi:uncharacterized membrane protein YhaH (DUF805 family)